MFFPGSQGQYYFPQACGKIKIRSLHAQIMGTWLLLTQFLWLHGYHLINRPYMSLCKQQKLYDHKGSKGN